MWSKRNGKVMQGTKRACNEKNFKFPWATEAFNVPPPKAFKYINIRRTKAMGLLYLVNSINDLWGK